MGVVRNRCIELFEIADGGVGTTFWGLEFELELDAAEDVVGVLQEAGGGVGEGGFGGVGDVGLEF